MPSFFHPASIWSGFKVFISKGGPLTLFKLESYMPTTPAVTEVSISSNALLKLGAAPITSLNDLSDRAIKCKRFYPVVRDAVLRDHTWNFAISRATLVKLGTAPDWGYANAFALPADFIRLADHDAGKHIKVKVEGQTAVTNASSLKVRYVRRETDTSKFDPAFVDMLTTRLAYELCNGVTNKVGLMSQLEKEYDYKLSLAKGVDGQEDDPETFEDTELNDVRRN